MPRIPPAIPNANPIPNPPPAGIPSIERTKAIEDRRLIFLISDVLRIMMLSRDISRPKITR